MNAQTELHSRAKDLRRDPSAVYARLFSRLTQYYLQERRDAGLPVSSAHSEAHLRGVSDLVPAIGKAYGFSEREVLLGRFAGQFHDIVRSGREDLGTQDEEESASKSEAVLSELNERGQFLTTPEEREAVSFAILNHGKPPAFFKDPERREETPQALKDKIHTMLYVSDGLQKLGVPLIHRRSSFVGGERRIEGDLKDMQYQGSTLSAIGAILLESAVRLGWKNVEGLYPQKVRPFIEPAFAIQRRWVSALLANKAWSMYEWASRLLNTRNGNGQNLFELSKIQNPPGTIQEIIDKLVQVGRVSNDSILAAQSDLDLVLSSVEAASYFAQRYKEDPVDAIRDWSPTGEIAKAWKKAM